MFHADIKATTLIVSDLTFEFFAGVCEKSSSERLRSSRAATYKVWRSPPSSWGQFGFNRCSCNLKTSKSQFLNVLSIWNSPQKPLGPEFHMVSMVFYTPEETIMKVAEAQERGYRIGNIGSRLVIRSSQTAPETYSKDVSGMSFRVDLNHVWYYTLALGGGPHLNYSKITYSLLTRWLWFGSQESIQPCSSTYGPLKTKSLKSGTIHTFIIPLLEMVHLNVFTHNSNVQVAGVSMNVLETTTVFEKKWLATRVNAAAACPKPEGKVCGNKTNNQSFRSVSKMLMNC